MMSLSAHAGDVVTMFVLDALLEDEHGVVEQHLMACARCRAAAQAMWEGVASLPYAIEPVTPAAWSKRALFARVRADLAGRPLFPGPCLNRA
ncbi:MAG: hypothetical protein ACRDIB_01440 [Ardenticatenaceae bacterium]